MNQNQLRQMSIFAYIVETGSITATAELLQLSKSVVSQHLKNLESELGVPLLKRTTRRQKLTSAGTLFYEQCKTLNQLADQAWQQVQSTRNEPQGKVKITAPNALMESLVVPAVSQLIQQYSKLEIAFISDDHQLNLVADNIDLAIRVGESPISNIKQKRIGEFRDILCGKTNYFTQQTDAKQLPYIANTWQTTNIKHEFKHQNKNKNFTYQAQAKCQADSFHTCLALIKANAGIGLIPDFIFQQYSNELKAVFPEYQLPVNTIYALHPYQNNLPLSVETCLQAIENKLYSLGTETKV